MFGAKYLKPAFYLFFTITLLTLFYRCLWNAIFSSVFDQDLTWYMPNFVWQTRGLSGLALIKYLLTPSLWYMDPITKSYFWICHSLFGLQIKYYIQTLILLHICNAFLVYGLCRIVKLSFQVSYFAALSSLFFFAQFHAYLWPMAFQHIAIVFFMLLGLYLYLKTDDLIVKNQKFTAYWALSFLVNILASFCRFNIVLLPFMMLIHILFCSSNDLEKIRKLKLWIPVMAIYLGNPLFSLFYAGDNRAHLYFTAHSYWQALLFGVIALITGFYLFKGYVKLKGHLPKNFERYFVLVCVLLGFCIVLCVKTFTNGIFEIGYSLLVPLIGCFQAFLDPLHTAQAITSTFVYHLIPIYASPVSYLLVTAWTIYFIAISFKEHKPLLILFAWYLVCYVYLVHQNPIRSRYFIYLAPIFAIIFCTVAIHIINFLFSIIRNTKLLALRRPVIVLLFACLFTSNIAAIKLALFRGRFVNNINTVGPYEYIRAATQIRDNIQGTHVDKPEQIVVIDAIPVPFQELNLHELTNETTDNFFNARAVFSQVFGDNKYFDALFQKPQPQSAPPNVYRFHNGRIEKDNLPIDPFFANFDLGVQQLKKRQLAKARESLAAAIQARPFLFRYLLGKWNFEDLRWITGDRSIDDWFGEVKLLAQDAGMKLDSSSKNTFRNIQEEINATIECLFYLAYLEKGFGDKKKEIYWIGQLKLLENNSERLRRHLMENPIVISDPTLKEYAENTFDLLRYRDLKDWNPYFSHYRFEKFVLRLLAF